MQTSSKNRVMGVALALSSECQHCWWKGIWRGGAQGVERVGKHCPVVWDVEWSDAKIIKIQYMVAIIGRQSANQNTTTNQKQVAAMEGSM
jgi:hypothetical protein